MTLHFARLIVIAFLLTSATGAFAQEGDAGPLVTRGGIALNLRGAELILEGAQARAKEMDLAVNIAVVDEGGHLIAFVRMDGARSGSGYTAQTKARAAATFRRATGPIPSDEEANVLLNFSLQNAAAAGGGTFTSLKGGIPIVVDEQVIGAVGVGGATGEQDAEIGGAGIEKFLDALREAEWR
jgi:glc operon protein GlcG